MKQASGPREAQREQKPPEASFVRRGVIFYGVLAGVAVIWRTGFYHEPLLFASERTAADGLSLGRDLLLGVSAAAALIGVSGWMTEKFPWGNRLAEAMAEAIGPLSLPNALLLAVASGVGEELLFRGALQPRVGLVLASLLFGCVHFVPRLVFLPWTISAIVAGFVFGGLFAWTGNLVAPVTAHILVNAVNLPLLVRRYAPKPSP